MIVVDASALLEFLLQTPLGTRVEARLFRDEEEFHAPHLVDVEVTQGLHASSGQVRCRLTVLPKRSRTSSTSIFTGTPISIFSRARGNCVRTSRRTTPCTSPWRRHSMRQSSPATRRSPRRQVTARKSKLLSDVFGSSQLVANNGTLSVQEPSW